VPPLTALEHWDLTQSWVGVIRRLVGLATRLGIDDLFFELMASTGYLEVATFESESEQAQVAANLAKFGELIDAFCDRRRDHSLGAFMAYLELVLLSESDEEVAQGEAVESAVQVMTIHQAKGLEFDAVFVPALVEGRLPQPHRGDRFRIPAQLAGEAGGREDQIGEERRLLYVAMTRARDHLALSWADGYEGSRAWRPSRFIHEIEASGRRHFSWREIPALGASLAASELRLLELGEEAPAAAPKRPPISSAADAVPRLSFSGISTYRECPRQFQFRYIHRLPVPTTAEAQYGNIIHAALQRLGKLRMEEPSVGEEAVDRVHTEVWEEIPFPDPRRGPAMRALGRKQLLDYLGAGGFASRPALVEEPFTADLDGWRLRGVIDRVDPPPNQEGGGAAAAPGADVGTWRIIDYKTGDPIPASRLRRDLQLALYALGAKRALGIGELELEIVYLKDSSRVVLPADAELLAEAEKIGSEVAAGVSAGKFEPRPERRRCALCAYRLACPAAL
jgi:DNA helicase-2/ATP-dependent DNA helicase PcrA